MSQDPTDTALGSDILGVQRDILEAMQHWNRFLEHMLALSYMLPFFCLFSFYGWWNLFGTRSADRIPLPPATGTTLIEYAKAGKREHFVWLARASGVRDHDLESLWRGVRRRLGFEGTS